MKRVGIDARLWDHPGIGRYIRELSRAMIFECPEEELAFLGSDALRDLLFSCEGASAKKTFFRSANSKIYGFREQWEIPRKSSDFDLLHVPHFNVPLLSRKKLVVTVHDLIYLRDPSVARSPLAKHYLSFFLKAIRKKAAAVIAVSEYTKKDLLQALPGLPADRVFVTYEAASPQFRKIDDKLKLDETRKKFSLSRPFVLYVGSLKTHKNIPTLIKAMAHLHKRRTLPHDLVVVGRKDAKSSEILELIGKNSFVRYLGELSDSDVVLLYNLAELFVLPSFWEGFGLPVLEAMACGTPVISSSRASLPEVVGEAGLLFEPERVDALSELIYNVLNNNDLREKMRRDGFEQAKKFSWQKTAKETLRIYRKVLA